MPSPSLLWCTLHIGGANLQSRATCDSPLLPRSHTDVPAPSDQRRCRIDSEHSCKLHTKAIRGCQSRSDRSDNHGSARTCQLRRRSRRKPAAACGTRASRMHGIRNVQLAGSPAVASRPAEAAQCFEVACKPPEARLPSEYARCGENLLRTQQAHTNTRPMPASGRMGATCSRRAPRSHHVGGLLEVECEG